MDGLLKLWSETGIANFELGQVFMMFIGFGLLFLAIRKGFEPLLLLPIGFGAILATYLTLVLLMKVDCCITSITSVLKRVFSHCLFLWAWGQ